MSVPTSGETFGLLTHHIRMAQEAAASLSHLANANDDRVKALQWLSVSEGFKRMEHQLRLIAMGKVKQ